jgi:dipeptidyl aminopeptidase/acylaminoacyl peptidase
MGNGSPRSTNYEWSGVTIVRTDRPHVEKQSLNDFYALNPSWSPDGRLLAITSHDPYGGVYILSVIDVANGERSVRRVVLLRHSSTTNAGTAPWSRSGARVAMPVCGDEGSHLYTLHSDGSGLREVTSLGRPLRQGRKLAPALVVWR